MDREIQFTECIGHGVKPHVLMALWRGSTVVMKAAGTPGDSDLHLPIDTSQDNFSITKDKFIDLVSKAFSIIINLTCIASSLVSLGCDL